MRIVIFACAIALVLTGCATSSPLPKIESKLGDRVGVIVETGDNPVHTHIGTTVFNNFAKKLPYDWNLSSSVTDSVKKALTKAGFTAVDLKAEGIRYSDVAGLIQGVGDKWKVDSGKDATLQQLRE